MKKFTTLTLALAMVFALCACGQIAPAAAPAAEAPAAEAPAEEVFYIKIGTTAPLTTHIYTNSVKFIEILKEISGGKMDGEVVGAGALGSSVEHYSQLAQGTLDMFPTGFDTATVLKGADDLFVTTVPYVFDDLEHYHKFADSELLQGIMEPIEKENGVMYLGLMGDMFPRQLTTTNKPITTPDDLKNVKMRTPESPAITAIWKAWGCNPMQVSASELYSALESGLCDGQDNDVVYSYNSSYYEIEKYDTELDYMQQALVVFFSQKTWDKMNDQQRAWVMEAIEKAEEVCTEEAMQEYADCKQKAIDQGCTFVEFDKEAFKVAAVKVAYELDGSLFSEGLYDQVRALAG